MSMLCARLERNDTIVARLSRELTEMKTHNMKYNLIFNFDKMNADCNEAEGENCIALVKHFLATVMSVPNAQLIYVPVAHRLGQRRPGTVRPILAKFPNVNELQTVLKHTNRLREYQAPKPLTVLILSSDDEQADRVFDVGQSSEVNDTSRTFKSYTVEVANLEEANDAMNQVLQMSGVASTTYVIHGY
ncbi:hypothetical protein LSH36_693g01083 [Paralvinella palmiformis]|uniref:Uncharacterized protein n=1 Tax=Paralvinella palmiformis TaxID=53620 RepID=A0AAD9J2Q4_9ANNE|nr:hypothetical protein LSH36_693g01083 [Paralvinella palmiformis]